jgi:hypothetical protein
VTQLDLIIIVEEMRSIWETVVACIILLNVVICGIGKSTL